MFEAGCGIGNTIFPLAKKFPQLFVHACDFSHHAITIVKDYAIGDYAQAMLINKNRVISEKFYFHGDGTAMTLQTFSLRCIRLHFSLYANAIVN
ncbi:methyltransferase-like protein 6 [Tanacetum coccineum]